MSKIVEGWISIEEMDYVSSFMHNTSGSILEVGACTGRLFSYLYQIHPNWTYVAVDPWEKEKVYTVENYKVFYKKTEKKQLITKKMFETNCPFAETHKMYYENFNTDKKFDIISIGAIKKNINWNLIYTKAFNMLNPTGIIIGRNLNHLNEGKIIQNVIKRKKWKILNKCKGSFVIERNKNV